jgi:hypothetical protein
MTNQLERVSWVGDFYVGGTPSPAAKFQHCQDSTGLCRTQFGEFSYFIDLWYLLFLIQECEEFLRQNIDIFPACTDIQYYCQVLSSMTTFILPVSIIACMPPSS